MTRENPFAGRRHGAALVTAALIAGTGLWLFLAPRSFYDTIATYPPYNEHFLHDAGAFLTGLGVAFFIAMRGASGFTVALGANAAAAILHAIAHIIDRDLGGRASDPWLLSIVAVALAVPAARRLGKSQK